LILCGTEAVAVALLPASPLFKVDGKPAIGLMAHRLCGFLEWVSLRTAMSSKPKDE